MSTTRVVPLRSAAAQPRRPRAIHPRPHSKPPSHLHPAAQRAWADIVTGRSGSSAADEVTIERAAVLLAYYREFGKSRTLVASLNALLRELGVPPLARARLRD